MKRESPFFDKMVDELVEFSQYDPELESAVKWLDEQSKKHGVSFYDKVYEVLYKYDINCKAKEWLKTR